MSVRLRSSPFHTQLFTLLVLNFSIGFLHKIHRIRTNHNSHCDQQQTNKKQYRHEPNINRSTKNRKAKKIVNILFGPNQHKSYAKYPYLLSSNCYCSIVHLNMCICYIYIYYMILRLNLGIDNDSMMGWGGGCVDASVILFSS